MIRTERQPRLRPRMQAAIEELQDVVRERYPDATFRVVRNPEDRRAIHLLTTVDVEDRDEVMDVVVDRVMAYLIAGVPIHVIPVRPAARNEALRDALQQAAPERRTPQPLIQP